MKIKIGFYCLYFLFVFVESDSKFSVPTFENDTEKEFQQLVKDIDQINNYFYANSNFMFYQKGTLAKNGTELLEPITTIAATVGIISGMVTLGQKVKDWLDPSKPPPQRTETPLITELKVDFENQTEKLLKKFNEIQKNIDAGVQRLIDHAIIQDFILEAQNKMGQLQLHTLDYLQNFVAGKREILKAKCNRDSPLDALNTVATLLPGFINAAFEADKDPIASYQSIVNLINGIINQFVLSYPTCYSILGRTEYVVQQNDVAINKIKAIIETVSVNKAKAIIGKKMNEIFLYLQKEEPSCRKTDMDSMDDCSYKLLGRVMNFLPYSGYFYAIKILSNNTESLTLGIQGTVFTYKTSENLFFIVIIDNKKCETDCLEADDLTAQAIADQNYQKCHCSVIVQRELNIHNLITSYYTSDGREVTSKFGKINKDFVYIAAV